MSVYDKAISIKADASKWLTVEKIWVKTHQIHCNDMEVSRFKTSVSQLPRWSALAIKGGEIARLLINLCSAIREAVGAEQLLLQPAEVVWLCGGVSGMFCWREHLKMGPGHTGGITSPVWSWNTLLLSQRSWGRMGRDYQDPNRKKWNKRTVPLSFKGIKRSTIIFRTMRSVNTVFRNEKS